MQVEAERELNALHSALGEFADLLDADSLTALQNAMQTVKVAIDTNDKAQLDHAISQLKPLSDQFASVIMNQSVKDALAGTKASDW